MQSDEYMNDLQTIASMTDLDTTEILALQIEAAIREFGRASMTNGKPCPTCGHVKE